MPVADLLISNGCMTASTQIAGLLLGAVDARNFTAVALSAERLRTAVSETVAGEEQSAFRGRVEDLANKAFEALRAKRPQAIDNLRNAVSQLQPPEDDALWSRIAKRYALIAERGALAMVRPPAEELPGPRISAAALTVFGTVAGKTRIEDQAIAAVDRMKAEQKAPSFLNLIPPEYRNWVITQADRAHSSKGKSLSINGFRELMAQLWLTNREMFRLLSSAVHFVGLGEHCVMTAMNGTAVLAITVSGSLIGVTTPKAEQSEKGTYFYERIETRETSVVEPQGELYHPVIVQIGARLYLPGGLNSSPVIAAAHHPSAGPKAVRDAVTSMSMSMCSLDKLSQEEPRSEIRRKR